ncbi:MAG: S8 family peptidase [Candidatus Kapabacteria bacterium]|nr:S8 family peptidase [Candidatus Kapabacteria bacterium]
MKKSLIILLLVFNFSFLLSYEIQVLEPEQKIGRDNPIFSNTLMIKFRQNYSLEFINNFLNKIEAQKIEAFLKPDNSFTMNPLYINTQSLENQNLEEIILREEPLLRSYFVQYNSSRKPEDICKELISYTDIVEDAEPVVSDELLGIPNDAMAGMQTMLGTIKAFDAWDYFQGDSNIVIGISDVGMLQDHIDLTNSIAPNYADTPNGIDDDGNGFVDDYRGCNLAFVEDNSSAGNTYHSNDHGTKAAGIAGATYNNLIGIAGVGAKCRIFPIKIAPKNSTNLLYSYRSIIYAAQRGLKVLNCSWGRNKRPSGFDMDIINYAVSRDVAIVASGGNNGNSEIFYPAGYEGVLGVGEVDQFDRITGTSNYGSHVRIMAPGTGNWVTDNIIDSFSQNFGGTSAAAPVISGAVAFIRAKYPYLNAVQALEFTRLCVDDISGINTFFERTIPGRINLLKAIETEPLSLFTAKPKNIIFKHTDGEISDRFNPGDTAVLIIKAKNYLGEGKKVDFMLSTVDDDYNSIQIIKDKVSIDLIQADSEFEINYFTFKINKSETRKIFLRVDITNESGYKDFFLIPFYPTNEITTFENDAFKFSMGDRGTVGFAGKSPNLKGEGVVLKGLGNQIWNAGFYATVGASKSVSSLWGNSQGSDFASLKPFMKPQKNVSIFDDSFAFSSDRIGLEVNQEVLLPEGNSTVAKILVTIKNTNDFDINDLAAGYYFDWDIGPSSDSNKVRLFTEAIPEIPNSENITAELVQYAREIPIYCGCASYSTNGVAQAAGFKMPDTFTLENQIMALNSGTAFQFQGISDIGTVVGMKFPGTFPAKSTKSFDFLFGCARNIQELAAQFRNKILSTENFYPTYENFVEISPLPARDRINLKINYDLSDDFNIKLFDLTGNLLENNHLIKLTENKYSIDVSNLNSGIYFIQVMSGSRNYFDKVIILK